MAGSGKVLGILLPAPKCQLFVEKFWYLTSSQGSRGKNAGISVFDQFARENMNRLWTFWRQCWYCHRIGNLLVLSSSRKSKLLQFQLSEKLCALVKWWGFSGQPSWDGFMWNVKSTTRCISASISRISGALSLPPISPPWHPQPDRHLFFAPQSVNGAYFLHSPPCRKWNCDEIHFFWAADWKAQYSHLAHCGRPNFSQFDIWQLGERFSWRGKCCKKHC